MALDNKSHVVRCVLCQDYSGSHLHVGLRIGLGCNLTKGKEGSDQTSENGSLLRDIVKETWKMV